MPPLASPTRSADVDNKYSPPANSPGGMPPPDVPVAAPVKVESSTSTRPASPRLLVPGVTNAGRCRLRVVAPLDGFVLVARAVSRRASLAHYRERPMASEPCTGRATVGAPQSRARATGLRRKFLSSLVVVRTLVWPRPSVATAGNDEPPCIQTGDLGRGLPRRRRRVCKGCLEAPPLPTHRRLEHQFHLPGNGGDLGSHLGALQGPRSST